MTPTVAISVEHLGKTFDLGPGRNRAFRAVEDASFQVRTNTAFGFLGPNGAGKTTTIKMITALIFPSSGRVEVLGGSPTDRATRARFGYLPENPTFPEHLTGGELLGLMGKLLGLRSAGMPEEIKRVLTRVDLLRAQGLQIRKYSKGMVQRLGIAQALLGDPELVILDEPMSGLDPIGRRDVKDLILDLRKAGRTVFFSTHIISDVEELCDDVAIVVNGRIARSGPVRDLISDSARELEVAARGLPAGFADATVTTGDTITVVVKDQAEARALMERIWAAGGTVTALRSKRYGLEDVFLQEVRKEPNRAPAGEPS